MFPATIFVPFQLTTGPSAPWDPSFGIPSLNIFPPSLNSKTHLINQVLCHVHWYLFLSHGGRVAQLVKVLLFSTRKTRFDLNLRCCQGGVCMSSIAPWVSSRCTSLLPHPKEMWVSRLIVQCKLPLVCRQVV